MDAFLFVIHHLSLLHALLASSWLAGLSRDPVCLDLGLIVSETDSVCVCNLFALHCICFSVCLCARVHATKHICKHLH